MAANPIHLDFVPLLDDDFKAYFNRHFSTKPPSNAFTIADIRAAPEKFAAPWCRDFTSESFVRDIKVASEDGHEIAVRCYDPDAETSPFGEGPYPVHVNFHGGGFCFGDLTQDAGLCMMMRNRVGIKVVDVDYRLTPENTFFKGHDDAWAVIKWVHSHGKELNIKPDSISIGGISAGGHISAVCQQLARDAKLDLRLAILSVPSVTSLLEMPPPERSLYPSQRQNAHAPWLTWDRLSYFIDIATPQTDAARAEIASRPAFVKSPIDGNLGGVCSTFIATASCDPLRDEAEAYGRRLVEQGVFVAVRRYVGVPHVFMSMEGVEKARLYGEDVCAELKKAHGVEA